MHFSLGKLRAVTSVIAALLGSIAIPAWAQNTSLAVIATDQTLDPLAEVLTVELSKLSGVTLLERAEIKRILGEQQLAASGGDNYVTLGQLLRADGVIVLRLARAQQQELLVADLVSVGLGFRLDSFSDRFPVNNPDIWTSDLKTRFTPLFQKFGVQPRDAIPLSLLNLRAAVVTTDARVLERSLSHLLADRLLRHPQVFLLERQHMGTLALEKDFMSGSTLPEWASARFVADGEIIQGGPEPDKITLRMTIEPPQHKSSTVFTVYGSRQQLGQLVEETAAKILAVIGRPTLEAGWQATEEAERFFREAMSAERAGLDDEALAAGEASQALDYHSDELIALLVRQSCRNGFSGRGELSSGYNRSQVDETSVDIGLVQRALELANAQTTNSTGLEVLLTASRIIRYYRETDGYSTHRQELELLRTTLRTTVQRMMAQANGMDNLVFCGFLASYAPYFYDDPSQVIACYRQVLQQRITAWGDGDPYPTARVRQYLAEARDTPRLFGVQPERTPWLVSWRKESPEVLKQIWETFLNELSASTNVNDQLDGLLLRLYSAEDEATRAAVENQIRDALWNARQSIVTDTFTCAIAVQLLYAIKGNSEAFQFKLLEYFFKEANFYDYHIMESIFTWRNEGRHGFKNPEYRKALLKPMDEYGSRVSGCGNFQAGEFARYRRRLMDGIAQEGDSTSPRILKLTKSWSPVFPAEPGWGMPSFDVRKVIYRDSQIWVLARGWTSRPSKASEAWLKVFQVEPQTLAETVLDVPQLDSFKPESSIDLDYDFDVSPHYVFVTTHGKLMRYDRSERTWTSTEVPPSQFPALTVLGNDLYYTYPGSMGIWGKPQTASGIIRINPQTLEQQVLASNRRKQSPTVLDDGPAYKIPSLFLGPGGSLHAVVNFFSGQRLKVFRFRETESDWIPAFVDEFKDMYDLLAFSGPDGVSFQRLDVSSRGAHFSAAHLHPDGRFEPLIAPAGSSNSPQHPPPPWLAPEPPWDYSTPPWSPLIATRNGKDCWVLLKYQPASSDSLALYHCVPGTEKPTVIPLGFAHSEAKFASRFACLFTTSAGLLLRADDRRAFWIIPWSELEEFEKAGIGTPDSK